MKQSFTIRFIFFAFASFLIVGCNKEISQETGASLQPETEVFTLTATYGSAETKVAFDDDGLNMTWQPGDRLYLVDITGQNSTVTMTSSITEPSKTASFKSTSSVLSGDYIVVYGQNTLSVSNSINMTSIANLNNQIRLYGTLTVQDGQTSASITLSQLFAMLTFKFVNLPGLSDMQLGMAATEDGTPTFNSGTIKQTGLVTSSSNQQMVYFNWNSGAEGKSFIAPIDFTGKTLYFFIYGTDADGKHVTYEFVKNGKNLRAGINYNLTFDFSQASSVCTLGKSSINNGAYVLNSAESFRSAAYWNQSNNFYSVEANVDFSGKVYFPINASGLYGNKNTLSNISVSLKNCSRVGVLSNGWVLGLTVKNSSFIGFDYVGALSGYCSHNSSISGCCSDGVTVQGHNYVGGLFGYLVNGQSSNSYLKNCSLIGTSTITGEGDYTGGIVGDAPYKNSSSYGYIIQNCIAKGTINVSGGGAYTGGIVGYSHKRVSECGFEGNVSGTSYLGGISGYSCNGVNKSYVYGNINGTGSNVGGVSGYAQCTDSYHIGDTSDADGCAGGITGYSLYYHISSTRNCYSYGTTSSGFGISYELDSSYINYNLTSSSLLCSSGSISANCNCGPSKTFLSKLSVINGNESYSTQVWKDIDAQCPLLQWQSDVLNGDIDIPGFGNEDW